MTNRNQELRWLSSSDPFVLLHQPYFDALSNSRHKVDIVLRVDNIAAIAQSDLLEALGSRPKMGRLIIYGMPTAQRGLIAARAAMLGLQIRFCETEDEAQMLLNKRRSRGLTDYPIL
ncbi:MAG TPA: hypothetical protein VKQ72_03745 [Aggregatilineales bacterium]|nr:hypothetical protein [Aggregatilineales bacterium]